MFVESTNNHHLFAHGGRNYGYRMEFHCMPAKQYIKIIMTCHNPAYHKNINKIANKLVR